MARRARSRMLGIACGLPLPQQEGRRLRRLHQHGAGRRLPRLRPAADRLRRRMRHRRGGPRSAWTASPFRRRNAIRAGDPMLSTGEAHDDVIYGSYGLDQCLDLMTRAFDDGGGEPPAGRLAHRPGLRARMINTIPPGGHFSDSLISLRRGRHLRPDRSAPPSSATAPPPRTGRSRPRCWRPRRRTSICARPTPAMAATTPAPSPAPASWSPAAPPSARRGHCATDPGRGGEIARRGGKGLHASRRRGHLRRQAHRPERPAQDRRRRARRPAAPPTASRARSRSTCTASGWR